MTRFSYLLPLALLTLSLPGQAQQVDDNMQARATVARSCSIVNIESLNFGQYDPVAVNNHYSKYLQATANIQVKCTAGMTGVALVLNEGKNATQMPSCAVALRKLAGPTSKTLIYRLLTEDSRNWGCSRQGLEGDAKTEILAPFTDSLTARQITIRGWIDAEQDVPIGTYTDTMNVQLTF